MVLRYGTNGNDRLNGSNGSDSIYGYDGDDVIFSSKSSVNSLIGTNTSFDIFEFRTQGDSGQGDFISAGRGNDIITGVEVYVDDGVIPNIENQDTIKGGGGYDVLIADCFNWGFDVTISAREVYSSIKTKSIESIIITDFAGLGNLKAVGTARDDIFILQSKSRMFGKGGDDFLQAVEGSSSRGNKLFGGKGNDTLAGGEGRNQLKGGSGVDTFILDDGGYTVIKDYSAGEKVYIDLFEVNGDDFDLFFDLDSIQFDQGLFNRRISYDEETGAIMNGNRQIGTIAGAPALEDVDFFIF